MGTEAQSGYGLEMSMTMQSGAAELGPSRACPASHRGLHKALPTGQQIAPGGRQPAHFHKGR